MNNLHRFRELLRAIPLTVTLPIVLDEIPKTPAFPELLLELDGERRLVQLLRRLVLALRVHAQSSR